MNPISIFIVFLQLLYCLPTAARIVTVCNKCPLNHIKSGLSQTRPGDTLLIKAGRYRIDPLEISKSIVLLGEDSPEIISRSGEELFTIVSDSVTVKGLTMSGVKTSYMEERAAIRLKRVKYFIIDSNKFNSNFFAIYMEHSSKGAISNNVIRGNAVKEISSGNAIHAWYCEQLSILNNYVTKHRDGIYFEFVKNSNIKYNLSENNLRYGLHFMFSNDNRYEQNVFKSNGAGVAVMFSRNIHMVKNRFEYNWGSSSYGLLLKEIFDAHIYKNLFTQNTIGIFVESSNRVKYEENNFEGNGWAVKVSGGCVQNEYFHNNFFNNSFDFSVFSSFNDSVIFNNYWADYSGYDLDRNGIGDVPHRPMKLFSYISQQSDESLILMRSLFIELLNFSEKVSPIFTPVKLIDPSPLMQMYETGN